MKGMVKLRCFNKTKRSIALRKNRVFRTSAFAILLTLALLPGIAHANNLAVNCPAGSLNAALAALPPNGPNTITVTGTCNENVFVDNMRSLTIIAGAGGATIVGPQDSDAFDIGPSQNITLQNLEIAGVPGSTPGLRRRRSEHYRGFRRAHQRVQYP
jgi:hypothetical protein